jgi:hypothetical protein
MRKNYLWSIFPCALLAFLGGAASQSSHLPRSLSINGHTGQTIVYQIDGKSYVCIQDLIQIAHGTISFTGNTINLHFPASEQPSAISKGISTGLSAPFMRASVQTLSSIEDWTNKLAYAAQRDIPGDGSQVFVFHDRASEALRMARVEAVSESDTHALQLLTNQFNTVNAWSNKLVAERKRMDTGKYSLSEDAIKRDETYQKISTCSRFLSSMLSSGTFHDDYSCR